MREKDEKMPQAITTETTQLADPTPLIYLTGVMDEETRPLLEAFIKTLKDGEGALVIYRISPGQSSSTLLESTIQQIAQRNWQYVSKEGDGGPEQNNLELSVHNISKRAEELRVPNILFAQGDAKIKAEDSHGICVGLIGNSDQKITHIKGIVHQQLNMGLNGDLIMHESEIILQALAENGAFKEGDKIRPIHMKTFGAGGSSSHETNPGDRRSTDAVIDIRTHVDPYYLADFFADYCQKVPEARRKTERDAFDDFNNLLADIRGNRLDKTNEREYTGIKMIQDITELARKAARYTGVELSEIIKTIDPDDKPYYGEITFASSESGMSVIHRIDKDANGQPFIGNAGQRDAIKALQSFLTEMSAPEKSQAKRELDSLQQTHDELRNQMSTVLENVYQFSKKAPETTQKTPNEPDSAARKVSYFLDMRSDAHALEAKASAKTPHLSANFRERNKELRTPTNQSTSFSTSSKTTPKDDIQKDIDSLKERIKQEKSLSKEDEKYLDRLIASIQTTPSSPPSPQQQVSGLSISSPPTIVKSNLPAAEELTKSLTDVKDKLIAVEKELSKAKKVYEDAGQADQKLRRHIQIETERHQDLGRESLNITASGNVFFTAKDKAAVGAYGAETVEMENNIFLQAINSSMIATSPLAKNIHIEQQHITKIAADPYHIPPEITAEFNRDAQAHYMTLNDYVEAFMWANSGQRFDDDFPESGRWHVAEHIVTSGQFTIPPSADNPNPGSIDKLFFNFGNKDNGEVKVLNPFWKEIGTDLVREIADGKAFLGNSVINQTPEKVKAILQEKANYILTNANAPDIRDKVQELFGLYLNETKPMRVNETNANGDQLYRVYARRSDALKTGFVSAPVHDWDSFIYKSSNTVILALKAAAFIVEIGQLVTGMMGMVPVSVTKPIVFQTLEERKIYTDKPENMTGELAAKIITDIGADRRGGFHMALKIGDGLLKWAKQQNLTGNMVISTKEIVDAIKTLKSTYGLKNKYSLFSPKTTSPVPQIKEDLAQEPISPSIKRS